MPLSSVFALRLASLRGGHLGVLIKATVYLLIATSLALSLSLTFGQQFDGAGQRLRGESRQRLARDTGSKQQEPKKDPYADRPRISTRNGHLLIEASQDKNIDFKTGPRGTITVNGHRLDQLLSVAKALERSGAALQTSGQAEPGTRYEQIVSTLFGASQRFAELESKLNALKEKLAKQTDRLSSFGKQVSKRLKQVREIGKTQDGMLAKLKENNCVDRDSGQPACRNGATCLDAYDSFRCLCPPNYEGPTCELDVDECAKFRGTDLGCQNNAKCINLAGGYRCECPPQFHGVHCTEQHDDCGLSSSNSLCGNGKCLSLARSVANEPRYECICDQGWTSDGRNPACVVDINECLAGQPTNASGAGPATPAGDYPCSLEPFVECENLPGSFRCGQCPAGYTGNGRQCRDLDECLTDNGGCSTAPLVECINLPGKRRCGRCPPGYRGDGITCVPEDPCAVPAQEGGCHPMARCYRLEGSLKGQRVCDCEKPYVGGGLGPDGCRLPDRYANESSSAPASDQNAPVDERQDDCNPNPCLNNGSCQLSDSASVCKCAGGWAGDRCERRAPVCGSEFSSGADGSLVFAGGPLARRSKYATNSDESPADASLRNSEPRLYCEWDISTLKNMSMVLAFQELTNKLEPSRRLQYFLTNTSSHSKAPPSCGEQLDVIERRVDEPRGGRLMARICNPRRQSSVGYVAGQQVPKKELTLVAQSNSVSFQYSLATQIQPPEPGMNFTLNWRSLEPVCGGDLPIVDSGSVSSPKFPEFYPAGAECRYLLRVPAGKRIRLQFGELNLLAGNPSPHTCSDSLTIIDGHIGPERPVLFKHCANNSTMMGRAQTPPPIVSSSSTVEVLLLSFASSTTPLMRPRQQRGFYLTYASESATPGCGGLFTAKSALIKSSDFEFSPSQTSGADSNDGSLALEMGRYFELKNNRPVGRWFVNDTVRDFNGSAHRTRCEYEIRPADQGRNHKIQIDWLEMPTSQAIDSSALNIWSRRLACTRGRLIVYDGLSLDGSNRTEIASFCSGDRYNASLLAQLQPIVSSGHVLYLVYESAPILANAAAEPKSALWLASAAKGFRLQYSTVCTALYYKLADRIRVELEPEVSECVYHIVLPANNSISLMIESKMSDGMALADGSCATKAIFMDGAIQRNPTALINAERQLRVYNFARPPQDGNDTVTRFGDTAASDANADSTPTDPTAGPQSNTYYQYSSSNTHDIKEFDVCKSSMVSFDSIWNHLSLMFRLSPAAREQLRQAAQANELEPSMARPQSQRNKLYLSVRYQAESACGGIVTEPREGTIKLEAAKRASALGAFPLTSSKFEQIHRDQLLSPCAWILKNSPNQLIQVEFDSPETEIRKRYDEWLRWTAAAHGSKGAEGNRSETLHGAATFNCSQVFQESVELFEPTMNRTRFLCPLDLAAGNRWTTQSDTLFIRLRNQTGGQANWPGKRALPNGLLLVRYTMLRIRDSACGGRLFHDNGVITSPRFPFNYPSRADCVWLIQVNPQQQIRLNFTKFELERQSKCLFDHLEIRNGPTADSPLIGRFCNEVLQSKVLLSHSSVLRLQFRSDSHLNRAGFQVYYDGAQTGCGGKLTTPTGQIDSPNYPLAYAHSADCEWTIQQSESNKIRLNVEDLDLSSWDEASRCPTSGPAANYLEIFDSGPEFVSKSLGRFCSKSQLKKTQFVSSSNKLHIVYRSQALDTSRGFRLTYDTLCSDIRLTGLSGVIESPGYPGSYLSSASCGWFIRAPIGSNLTLVVADLELEDNQWTSEEANMARVSVGKPAKKPASLTRGTPTSLAAKKCNDKLRIFAVDLAYNMSTFQQDKFVFPSYQEMQQQFSSNNTNASINLRARGLRPKRSLCGQLEELSDEDRSITIDTNGAFIAFDSDKSLDFRGFRLEWRAQGCGGHYMSDSNGPISFEEPSAGGPIECIWTLDLGRTGNILDLSLNSDMRLPDPSVLVGANGSRLSACSEASLTIYDGLSEDSPVLTRNCDAHKLRETITTSGAQALVKFVSSGRHHAARGFVLNAWPSIKEGCMTSVFDVSTPFNEQAGSKESPNYPELYDATTYRCHAILSAHAGRLRFKIDELEIPVESEGGAEQSSAGLLEPDKCLKSGNYLLLRNYGRNIDEVFCGKLDRTLNANRTEIVFEQEAAWSEFVSKSSLRGKWRFTFDRLCGSQVHVDSAHEFATPNYPAKPSWPARSSTANTEDPERSENVCLWRIKSSLNYVVYSDQEPEKRIHLNVMDFRRFGANPTDCLRIYEGVNISLRQSQFNLTQLDRQLQPRVRICSEADLTHQNLHYLSRGTEVSVLISGDVAVRFAAKTFENYCGGEYHLDRAEFASPDYPQPYGPNLDCNYFVVGSPGATIKLSFPKIDLPEAAGGELGNALGAASGGTSNNNNCDSVDYIEIRQRPLWRKVNVRLRALESSDSSHRWSDVGYLMAAVNASSSAGDKESTNGTASSKATESRLFELAKLYYILAPQGELTSRGQLARHGISLDSFFESSKLLGRFCGQDPVDGGELTLKDEVLLRFRSHSPPAREFESALSARNRRAYSGFLTKYSITYGGLIKLGGGDGDQELSGLISSPGFPAKQKLGSNSAKPGGAIVWSFETTADSVIQFDLISLDLGPTQQNCLDSLGLFDGLNPSQSSPLALLCGHLSFRNLAHKRMGTNWANTNVKPLDLRQLTIHLAHNSKVRADLIRSHRSSGNVASVLYENSRNESSFLLRYRSVRRSQLASLVQQENEELLAANLTARDDDDDDNNDQLSLTSDRKLLSKSCSGSFKLNYGPNGTQQIVVASPNWPQEPPHDIECHWLISTQEDATVRFFVDPVDVNSQQQQQPGEDSSEPLDPLQLSAESRNSAECLDRRSERRNLIIIHDGATTLAPVLARHCLPMPLMQVQSSGRQMLIRYIHADRHEFAARKKSADSLEAGERRPQVSASFKGRASIGKCGGQYHVVGMSRIRDRQDASKLYENNLDCKYYLFASSQDRVLAIHAAMSDFNLSSEPTDANCSVGDYIEIRDLPIQNDMMDFSRQLTGRSLGRYCAGKRLDYLESPGSAITIEFRTDAANAAKGWDLFVMTAQPRLSCPRGYQKIEPDDIFGRLISPNWPHGFSGKRHCKYLLVAPINQTIELTFVRLRRPRNEAAACLDKLRYLDDNEAVSLRYNSQTLDELSSPLSGTLMRSLVQEVPCKVNSSIAQITYNYASDTSVSRVFDDSLGVKTLSAEKYEKLLELAPTSPYKIRSSSHTLMIDYVASNLAAGEGFVAVFRLNERASPLKCGGEIQYSAPESRRQQLALSSSSSSNEGRAEPQNLIVASMENIEKLRAIGSRFYQCDWSINMASNYAESRNSIEFNLAASNSSGDFPTASIVFQTLDIPSANGEKFLADEDWSRDKRVQTNEICGVNRFLVTDQYYLRPFYACGNNTGKYRYLILSAMQRQVSLRMELPAGSGSTAVAAKGPKLAAGIRAYLFEKSCPQVEALAGEAIRIRSHRGWPNSSYEPGICRWDLILRTGDYRLWFEKVQFRPPSGQTGAKDCDGDIPDLDYVEIKSSSEPEAPVIFRYCYFNQETGKQRELSIDSASEIVITFVAGLGQLERNVESFLLPGQPDNRSKNATSFGFELQFARVRNSTSGDFCRRYSKFNVYRMIRRTTDDYYDLFYAPQPNQLYPKNQHCVVELNADEGARFNFTFRGVFDLEYSAGCQNDYVRIDEVLVAPAANKTTPMTTTTAKPPQKQTPKKTGAKQVSNKIASVDKRQPDETFTLRLVGKWCGLNRPTGYFLTQSNKARVTFHSNGRIEGTGFNLEYTIIS